MFILSLVVALFTVMGFEKKIVLQNIPVINLVEVLCQQTFKLRGNSVILFIVRFFNAQFDHVNTGKEQELCLSCHISITRVSFFIVLHASPKDHPNSVALYGKQCDWRPLFTYNIRPWFISLIWRTAQISFVDYYIKLYHYGYWELILTLFENFSG